MLIKIFSLIISISLLSLDFETPFVLGKTLSKEQENPNLYRNEPQKHWSLWRKWDTFPHDQIQLGMSNMDYGGMMDMEYRCFGSVGSENDAKKSQSYWYRLANEIECIGQDDYIQIEVGCWMEEKFRAKMIVKGIILTDS